MRTLTQPSTKRQFAYLLGFLAINLIGAALGGLATASSVGSWYATIEKPGFTPPGWVFGPAWTTLYALMATSAWLVWRKGPSDKGVKTALLAYFVQLVINFAWSPLFFGMQSPILGLVNIIILLAAIVWMLIKFYRISLPATGLMLPYLLWVCFATALNFEIYRLN